MGRRKQKPKLNTYQCKGSRCKCEACKAGNEEATKRIKARIRAEI